MNSHSLKTSEGSPMKNGCTEFLTSILKRSPANNPTMDFKVGEKTRSQTNNNRNQDGSHEIET